jgi:hypothetical protein
MSIQYYCDICKNQIKQGHKKLTVVITSPDEIEFSKPRHLLDGYLDTCSLCREVIIASIASIIKLKPVI